MSNQGLGRRLLLCSVLLVVLGGSAFGLYWLFAERFYVYLTWQQEDTSRTMLVNFCDYRRDLQTPEVRWSNRPGDGTPDGYPNRIVATRHQVPGVDLSVFRAEMTGLEPATEYHFVVVDGEFCSDEEKFRTLPDDDRPMRLIFGGDNRSKRPFANLLREAVKFDPEVIVIGGDLAYANAEVEKAYRWRQWLAIWCDNARTSDGRLIPLIAGVGNHDAEDNAAPLWFAFVGQGGSSYFVRRLGALSRVYVLDSGHVIPHGPSQARWFAERVAENPDDRHKIAVYHVPLYPTDEGYDDKDCIAGRKYWLPTIDRHEFPVAFEHHDHTLKRTYPLRGDQIVRPGEGTVYLGDGCFGMSPREISDNVYLPNGQPYLAMSGPTRHFWLVEMNTERLICTAIGEDGEVIDKVTVSE